MKMKKLFAGLVATSMVAAMGTSAMAAVNSYALNPTVDETGVAKISEADVAKLDDYADTQMTVLIIPEAAYNKMTDDDDETNITDDDIYYIDQMAANDTELFQKMGLKCGADLIPEGETSATYYVRVGGAYDINDGIYEGSFTVTKAADTPTGVKYLITFGDANGDGSADEVDAGDILSKLVGGPATFINEADNNEVTIGETYGTLTFGDANGDGSADEVDAGDILSKLVGGPATFINEADNTERTIGETYEVIVNE